MSKNLSCETGVRNGNQSHVSEIARFPRYFSNINSANDVSMWPIHF